MIYSNIDSDSYTSPRDLLLLSILIYRKTFILIKVILD